MGSIPAAARDILRYFLRNAGAADDTEGIARWRLLDEDVRRNVAEVQDALSWLVRAGFLIEEAADPKRKLFRLKQGVSEQAEDLIAASRETTD